MNYKHVIPILWGKVLLHSCHSPQTSVVVGGDKNAHLRNTVYPATEKLDLRGIPGQGLAHTLSVWEGGVTWGPGTVSPLAVTWPL